MIIELGVIGHKDMEMPVVRVLEERGYFENLPEYVANAKDKPESSMKTVFDGRLSLVWLQLRTS